MVEGIQSCEITLRDGSTGVIAPYYNAEDIPREVLESMHLLMNEIVREGKTYPVEKEMTLEEFKAYFCAHFVGVMTSARDGSFIGSFYIKPNYVGRCSHICNGGFMVNTSKRGLGAASALGETYTKWAPLLGYKSSVFNLVFKSNPGSYKIWDKLGYTRVGVVKDAGRLKLGDNGEEIYTDAIIYQKMFD